MILRILRKIKYKIEYLKEEKEILKSKSIDISTLETICFLSGPYRNLTTLTASMAVLHPNCQVLNHAQGRILPHNKVDFFKKYSTDKFHNFVRYAIRLSLSGFRGRLGGNILFSHAFDKNILKEKYRERFGEEVLKKNIKCLLWKEGLHLKNHLIKNDITEIDLIRQNSKIKFILPIRNPLDCAKSNQNTGMSNIFININDKSNFQEILKEILDAILEFLENKKQFPSNFFHYYQHSFNEDLLIRFCDFMTLPFDEKWKDDVLEIFNIKPSYSHNEEDIVFYKNYVNEKFTSFPDEMENLIKFV